jgi:hypothetical protein
MGPKTSPPENTLAVEMAARIDRTFDEMSACKGA